MNPYFRFLPAARTALRALALILFLSGPATPARGPSGGSGSSGSSGSSAAPGPAPIAAPIPFRIDPPPLARVHPPTLPMTLLPTRQGDPAFWSDFQACVAYLEGWVGRDLPDWVVHSAILSYPARRPLYDASGAPLRDATGQQRCVLVPQSGRVFFPPAWRVPSRPRLPLVLYPHATMLGKQQVASEYAGHEWVLAAAAAVYYGYAVAMPDQPGMGANSQDYHTFCHAKALAYATLDALPATARLTGSDPYLAQRDYGWDGRLYVMGYSEGGYTALASVRELEAHPEASGPRFRFMGSACMAGPFDLSGTTRREILDPVQPFPHCFYLPYVIRSYQSIYGDVMDPLAAFAPVLLEPRDDGNVLQWVDGLMDGLEVDLHIGRRLGLPADAVVLRRILNPAWVTRKLDDPAFATSPIRRLLEENDLWGGWRPTHPLLFCQSLTDREVPLQNTRVTLAGLSAAIRQAGDDPERLLAFLPIGSASDRISHVAAALVAIPAAFNWFYQGMPVR